MFVLKNREVYKNIEKYLSSVLRIQQALNKASLPLEQILEFVPFLF